MFKGLKDKLKGALSSISAKIKNEDAVTEEPAPEPPIEEEEQKPEIPETPATPEKPPEPEEDEPEAPEEPLEQEPEKEAEQEEPEPPKASKEPEEPPEQEEPEPPKASKEPEEPPKQEPAKPEPEKPAKKKGLFKNLFKKEQEPEQDAPEEETKEPREAPEPKEPPTKKEPEKKPAPEPKKTGFFTKLSQNITTIQLSEEKFEELFWDLELTLLENNVAVSVIERIKHDLKEELTTGRTARGEVEERIMRRLEETLRALFDVPTIDLLKSAEEHTPLIIAVVGVNGSGKTTSLAKLAAYFQKHQKTCVLAACDTFRAAAIQQLEAHAKKLKVPIIKQEYGADPAAVAYDAVAHAKAKGIDIVLIDTAGRLHSNTNLMDEIEKVVRVAKPHHVLFVGEAVTGNDCVEQAERFSETLPVDGIILTKADVDEKGGAAVSVSHVTGKPILFLGTGQAYEDLTPFAPEHILELLLTA